MKKSNLLRAGLLGLTALVPAASATDDLQSIRVSEELAEEGIDPILGHTCYGLPCSDIGLDTCSDEVINRNLERLRKINIVSVEGLSPFACTGYCFSAQSEEARQAQKCEKAHALNRLVVLAAPLRVKPGN